jgi:hypothetical protein
MKLFVAFHYSEEDKWIKELVIPLITTLDIEVRTGENIHGQVIVEEVPDIIRKCDGLLAFITTSWAQYPWVRDELVTALTIGIPALEIKDRQLGALGGATDGRQRVEFDAGKKEVLLVQLAQILAEWKKRHNARNLLLLPDEVMKSAKPHLNSGLLKCIYQFRDGNEESQSYEAIPFRLPQALAVNIRNIPSENAMIQLTIKGPDFSYSSGYQTFSFIPINLQRD